MRLNKMKNDVDNNRYILKSGDYSLDFSAAKEKEIYIENEVNSSSKIYISNLNSIESIIVDLKEGSYTMLSLLFEDDVKPIKIVINVKNNAVLEGFFADFSSNTLSLDCQINLKEEGANAYVKLASLSSRNDDKEINISINHISPKTYGKVDNYGVCKDAAKLLFAGTSHIFEKSIKSKTEQNAKIMVFDEACDAVAKPILRIDENDIEASHAAAVGKISDEHLFYLTSRGISEAEAKQLITMGYLKPILAGFHDEQIKDHISSLIERRM